MRFSLTLLAFVTLFLSCETSETVTLPTQADQFIRLQIGEQTVTLNAVSSLQTSYFYPSQEDGALSIERASADNLHVLRLGLDGCTPERGGKQTFTTKSEGGCAEVSIDYTTFELNNDPYCPHLEGVPSELTGTIVVENWDNDGIMTGSFESSEHGAYTLSGDFRILVEE